MAARRGAAAGRVTAGAREGPATPGCGRAQGRARPHRCRSGGCTGRGRRGSASCPLHAWANEGAPRRRSAAWRPGRAGAGAAPPVWGGSVPLSGR